MKAIIVEDEFPAREELKYFIKNFSKIEILNEFDNGVEVLKFIQANIFRHKYSFIRWYAACKNYK